MLEIKNFIIALLNYPIIKLHVFKFIKFSDFEYIYLDRVITKYLKHCYKG